MLRGQPCALGALLDGPRLAQPLAHTRSHGYRKAPIIRRFTGACPRFPKPRAQVRFLPGAFPQFKPNTGNEQRLRRALVGSSVRPPKTAQKTARQRRALKRSVSEAALAARLEYR